MKVPENKEQTMRNDGEARLGGILTNYEDLFGTKDTRTEISVFSMQNLVRILIIKFFW